MMKATRDDAVSDAQLTTLGPTAVPPEAHRDDRTRHRKTVAWSENGNETSEAKGNAAAVLPPSGFEKPPRARGKPIHKLALLIVFLQGLWAWAIPLKNIATVTLPFTRPDASKTQTLPYRYVDASTDIVFSSVAPQAIPGTEIPPLLKNVLDIILTDDLVRQKLTERGGFDVSAVYSLLNLEAFAVMAKYASLVHQATEFPGGRLTTRPLGDQESKLTVVLREPSSGQATRNLTYALYCSHDNAALKATRCTRVDDGYPCDADTSTVHTYEDVDLEALGDGTGLRNNVALLYVIDYFHQAMATLLASQDWSTALDDLSFNQTTPFALDAGATTVFTSDGHPYLMSTDAFVIGLQATEMKSTGTLDVQGSLDSCVAAEIVVAQFYVRALVLRLIQDALVAQRSLFKSESPQITVPSTMDTVLAPVWKHSILITSGARAIAPRTTVTRFFKQDVATVTMAAAQFKLDRKEASASQVPGSSLRLLQYMVFYTDIVSRFSSTVSADGSYDTQTYTLIGWLGSDITTFRDSYTASSLMVYHLAELSATDAPRDTYWDDEAQYALYFKGLESSMATAPFKVFDSHLVIKSGARVAPSDDEPATRCHRALFKVVTKLVYLSLLELSKPASYLMYMGEVSSGAKPWLLSQAFNEELLSETFSGERLAFAYRNGPYTRKDDGSGWVAIPLLQSMISTYGKDATATALLQEIDASLKLFLKESNGNVNFPDASMCYVSGADGTPDQVTSSDALDQIYDKILPGLQSAILDLLDEVPTHAAAFKTAMEATGLDWLRIDERFLVGSPVVSNTTEGHGPPTPNWLPTVLTVGLRKLWPPKTPTDDAIQRARSASVCYQTLDTRFFNVSSRCFAEPSNAVVLRTRFRSESMRKFFELVWSMAVMLNTMAFVVVLKYIRKLYKAYAVTQFECLDVEVALQLNLQGMGVLNISQVLLLLVASLPALITFHISADLAFMPFFLTEKRSKPVIDVFVTLSMSWFVKLGFDVCNICIRPKRPVDWYHLIRVRWFMLVVILVLRLITPEGIANPSYQLDRLVLTCVISLLLGACCTFVIFLPERPGKVVAEDQKQSHDTVVAALVKQNMPLTKYGVLGRTSKGWSMTGLIVEGWRLGRTADGGEVLRKDGGEILLPKPSDERQSASRVEDRDDSKASMNEVTL